MKTEGKNKMEIFRMAFIMIATVGVLALFAFAASQQALAGTVTVPSPKETASIHLGVKDPPAFVMLKGWYCESSHFIKHVVSNEYEYFYLGNYMGHNSLNALHDKYSAMRDNPDWPFNKLTIGEGSGESVDAPPGGTKTYKFCCYTKADLQAIKRAILAYADFQFDPLNSAKAKAGRAAGKALDDWLSK